jgi:hypothetical protein
MRGESCVGYFCHWLSGFDVSVSAVALIAFIRREGARLKLRTPWVPVAATCLIGVSCGLPLFLYLRERKLALDQ